MSIPSNIEELAHKVRTEIYGRDVREALATSMEATAEVAEWSRQVAQQIIDGEFDEAELSTEIERKLNELEQEYAPELTNIKNEVEDARGNESTLGNRLDGFGSQLAQTEIEIAKKADKDEIFTMANMGQDIKEAMTGGSVAVVGENTILTENIVDKQVTISKVEKAIQKRLRPENVHPPLSELEGFTNSPQTIDIDIYRTKTINNSNNAYYQDGKVVAIDSIGTKFYFTFYVTNEMREWKTISFGINMKTEDSASVFRVDFRDSDDVSLGMVNAERVGNSDFFVAEGVEIPNEAVYFYLAAVSNESYITAEYSQPILTYGDTIGSYNTDYFDQLFNINLYSSITNLLDLSEKSWRQGSIVYDANLDDAFTDDSIFRISTKKELYIKNENYKKLYWFIENNLQAAVVQFDKNGNQIENTEFKKNNLFVVDINKDTEKIYFLLAYKDNSRIRPSDVKNFNLYFGENENFRFIVDVNEVMKPTLKNINSEISELKNRSQTVNRRKHAIELKTPYRKIIGHGGAQRIAPEMSMEAYEFCKLLGYWGVEGDPQLTKDDNLVLMHDATLDRATNGTGNIVDYTVDEIKQLKITLNSGLYDHDIKVPTIDEFLVFCRNNQMAPIMEIKDYSPDKQRVAEIMIDRIKRYNLVDEAIIIAFSWSTLEMVRNIDSDVWVSHIKSDTVDQNYINSALSLGNFILFNYNGDLVMNEEQMKLLRDNNIPVLHGVADVKSQFDYYDSLGFDALMTNELIDKFRQPTKFTLKIETNDNGQTWTSSSPGRNFLTLIPETINSDFRFMINEIPRHWLEHLNGTIMIEYLGIDDVIVRAYYDRDIKKIRTKFYENGILKGVGDIPNGSYNVTIFL